MLRTDEESKLLISANTEHNHDTDARKIERQQIRVSVKRKANNDIAERPQNLYVASFRQERSNI
jgi:hypothetical protein